MGAPVAEDAGARARAALVGESAPMRRLRAEIARLAAAPWRSVLVLGETGTGKDLVAQALAACSPHLDGRLEVFNCPAVPADHLESELFGTTRGAYPGSLDRPGAAERAAGGLLFLDEIASMAPAHQAKVLRLLESGEARRLGAGRPYRTSAAVAAATHVDPAELLERGLLRSDLYWRLVQDGVIELPPLRERPGDLPLLAARFLAELPGPPRLAADALAALEAHDWPGNVRELRAVLRGAARLCSDAGVGADAVLEALRRLRSAALGSGPGRGPTALAAVAGARVGRAVSGADGEACPPAVRFAEAGREARRRMLVAALEAAGGNRTQAGIRLGFHAGCGAASHAHPVALDLRARKLAHRRFRYWWDRLVEPGAR